MRKKLLITFFVSFLCTLLTISTTSSNINNEITINDDINAVCFSADISNLYESADPVELGDSVLIRVEVLDPQGFEQVLIEIEGTNRSMVNIQGDTWEYNWTPTAVGIYPYTIYAKFNVNKWNSLTDSLEVKTDATPPEFEFIPDGNEKIKLGEKIKIKIKVKDSNGVDKVTIQINGGNYSMINVPGTDIWEYDEWAPSSSGVYTYTICMEDTQGNSVCTIGVIQIIDDTSKNEDTNDLNFESLWIFPLIISALVSVSGIIAYKKAKHTQQVTSRKKVKAKKAKTSEPDVEKSSVTVVCPICKTNARILLPKTIINESRSLTTVSIPRDLTCEHHYQTFIDKNFIVRGYQKVDYEFDSDHLEDIEVIEENQQKE